MDPFATIASWEWGHTQYKNIHLDFVDDLEFRGLDLKGHGFWLESLTFKNHLHGEDVLAFSLRQTREGERVMLDTIHP